MNDWKQMWLDTRRGTLACMCANLEADLTIGAYNPAGDIVRHEIEEIVAYRYETERTVREWRFMDAADIQKWCYRDLRKKGVIE